MVQVSKQSNLYLFTRRIKDRKDRWLGARQNPYRSSFIQLLILPILIHPIFQILLRSFGLKVTCEAYIYIYKVHGGKCRTYVHVHNSFLGSGSPALSNPLITTCELVLSMMLEVISACTVNILFCIMHALYFLVIMQWILTDRDRPEIWKGSLFLQWF